MRVVVAELHRPSTEATAEGHAKKTETPGKKKNKNAKVDKKQGPSGKSPKEASGESALDTPPIEPEPEEEDKTDAPSQGAENTAGNPGKVATKRPSKASFTFREVRGAAPRVNYFAKYLWPKAQFFEFQFRDLDLDKRDHTNALRDFVTKMPDETMPYVRYPLAFLTFSQRHVADRSRGCYAAGRQDVFNVHKASNINRLPPPKQAKYSKLLFTLYDEPIRELGNVIVDVVADVTRNEFTFSDGCGTISADLMDDLMQSNGQYKTSVCAVQCRLPGIKGVLAVDATSPRRTIRIRPSMIKLDVLSVLAHTKPTPSAMAFPRLPIVVLKTNTASVQRCGTLNDQIVALLLQRGVPASAFEDLTRQYIDSVKYMGLDCRYAMQFYKVTGRDDAVLRTACAARPLPSLQPSSQLKSVHNSLLQVQSSAIASLKNAKKRERLKIPVAESRLLLGVCDHTMSLRPGECFLQLDDGGGARPVVQGAVAVTRNPCYHRGDIRVLRAVSCPALMHLTNVVVFSVQGDRPAPDEMAGGDLDGDIFLALWDRRFVPPTPLYTTPTFDYKVASVRSLVHTWAATNVPHACLNHRPMARPKKERNVAMHHVVEHLVMGGSTHVVARVDGLLQQLLALPPSPARTDWTNVLNAMFVCGIDHLSDVVDVDIVVDAIQRNIQRHAAEAQQAPAPSTMDTMDGLLAHVRSLNTMEATPVGLALTMFASSLAKIDRPVAATDFEDLTRLFLWAVIDVLSDVERQVLKDATIPDEFAAQFQPKIVRQVVALLDQEAKTLQRMHTKLSRRQDMQTLGRIRQLRSDMEAKTEEATKQSCKIKEEVREVFQLALQKKHVELAQLVKAVHDAKTPPSWLFSWTSWQPSREVEQEIATNEAKIQTMTGQVVALQKTLASYDEKIRQIQGAAAALAEVVARISSQLEQEVAVFTPEKEEALLNSIRDFQHHLHLRDQFVQVCTALATLRGIAPQSSHPPTNLALLNECLVTELHMFESKLPVYTHRTSLVAQLHATASSSMQLVVSETGSGKSTCLPQFYLTESILRGAVSSMKRFCVVVPRRVAAKNLAKYMASMRKAPLGETVGYHIGTSSATKSDRNAHKTKTLLECVSGGIILGKSISDPWFAQFSIIFVDEVHEESADLYMLLGKLKAARTHHPMLRVVFMSAKVDEARLQAFFGTEMPVETIEGRSHPVTSIHHPSQVDYMSAVISTVVAIHRTNPILEFPDILVFLPRISDIEEAVGRIDELLKAKNGVRNLVPLPLHSRVDDATKAQVLQPTRTTSPPPDHTADRQLRSDQSKKQSKKAPKTKAVAAPTTTAVAAPKTTAAVAPTVPSRRVIFATNIAEASLTIPGVGNVVDSGLEVVVSRDVFCGATVHSVRFIAQTSVVQRKGRCGREGPGTCHHLYSTDQLAAFATTKKATYPDLEHIVLRLIATDTNPFDFDWFEHPGTQQLQYCVDLLVRFRMIDVDVAPWRVTAVGKQASKLLQLGLDLNAVQLLLVARDSDVYDEGSTSSDEEDGDLVEKAAIVIACVEYSSLFRKTDFNAIDDVDWDRMSVCDNFVNLFYEYKAAKSKKAWAHRLDLPLHAFASMDRRRKEIVQQMQRLGQVERATTGRRSWAQCVAEAFPTTRLKLVRFNAIGPEFIMVNSTQGDKTIRLSRDEIARQRLVWTVDKTYVALLVTSSAMNPSALFAKFVEEIDDAMVASVALVRSYGSSCDQQ